MGCKVTIVDNLTPQVHLGKRPAYLNKKAKFIRGDVLKASALRKAALSADVIYHFAAAVGVGQSQYEIQHYVDTNIGGTGVLLDLLANGKRKLKKIVIASSMSAYGEGAYDCNRCGRVRPPLRTSAPSPEGPWDPPCPNCGASLKPLLTSEADRFICNSVYAVTKMTQEELVLNFGAAYQVPAVALRFFNIYGPRQSLSNPYTGVAAIFMSRARNENPPVVYEDGRQSRDFIHVNDIVQGCILAMEKDAANGQTFNLGTGTPENVGGLGRRILRLAGLDLEPTILRTFRRGDVRHCVADITKARKWLGFEPQVTLDQGLRELMDWSKGEKAVDKFDRAHKELVRRGLV
jgi:dTDP-L-rhamnose 4-epimerase